MDDLSKIRNKGEDAQLRSVLVKLCGDNLPEEIVACFRPLGPEGAEAFAEGFFREFWRSVVADGRVVEMLTRTIKAIVPILDRHE